MIEFNLKSQKNLLAFSSGIDSVALFFLLKNKNIPFDIAIVDYNIRNQSKDEVLYAQELAKKYNKKCFVKSVKLKKDSNFEFCARKLRYDFFEELINNFGYETLLTAHQLNDRLEWFFMQLSKGAGLNELLSLNEFIQKENYSLYRPLLNTSKATLENFLLENKYKYFIDESNFEDKYRRNHFRKNFSNAFLKEFEKGVKNSFAYLQKDLQSFKKPKLIFVQDELEVFENAKDDNINIHIVDQSLKKRGYILSSLQRNEILKQKECVIDKFAICLNDKYIFICPFYKTAMPKKFKENCRILKIPKKIRPYLFEKNIPLLL